MVVLGLATGKCLGEFYDYSLAYDKKMVVDLREDRVVDMLYLLSRKYSHELELQVRKMMGPDWLPANSKIVK